MSLGLSIVVPVYNEIHTIDTVLSKVIDALPGVPKEIVLVDDGSKDGTRQWLIDTFGDPTYGPVVSEIDSTHPLFSSGRNELALETEPSVVVVSQQAPVNVKVVFHKRNQGKGAALRTGFQEATGDVIVIQDADLEYDPQDWTKMWRLISEGKADVVYGSRFYGDPHRVLYFHHLLGNKTISALEQPV